MQAPKVSILVQNYANSSYQSQMSVFVWLKALASRVIDPGLNPSVNSVSRVSKKVL